MYTSLYSPEVQAVLNNAANPTGQAPFPSPADWRDQGIYFLMVDRFNNDANHRTINRSTTRITSGYQGGNFAGIQQSSPTSRTSAQAPSGSARS